MTVQRVTELLSEENFDNAAVFCKKSRMLAFLLVCLHIFLTNTIFSIAALKSNVTNL